MKKFTFDLGGSGTKYIVFDSSDNLIEKNILKNESTSGHSFETNIKEIFEKISILILSTIKEGEKFELGISIPGIVDSDNYQILERGAIVNDGINIKQFFMKFKNLTKFIIENDGNAATIGEFLYRNNKNINNFIHITLGSGLGMGLIINNSLYKGKKFKAGEIVRGYTSILVDNNEPLSLEVGVAGAICKYNFLTKDTKINSGIELFKLYKENNKLALKIIDDLAGATAKLIINLHYLLDFDLLTIGGAISSNKKFTDLIFSKLNQYKTLKIGEFIIENKEILKVVEVSKLKNDAACFGMLNLLNKTFKL